MCFLLDCGYVSCIIVDTEATIAALPPVVCWLSTFSTFVVGTPDGIFWYILLGLDYHVTSVSVVGVGVGLVNHQVV